MEYDGKYVYSYLGKIYGKIEFIKYLGLYTIKFEDGYHGWLCKKNNIIRDLKDSKISFVKSSNKLKLAKLIFLK
jgi:hypothetical protein